MNEPTDGEVKEFWELCGLSKRGGYWWQSPDGKHHLTANNPPPINLNSLFKYAVPKLGYWLISAERYSRVGAVAQYEGKTATFFNEDPAIALFWAIYEVLKSKSR